MGIADDVDDLIRQSVRLTDDAVRPGEEARSAGVAQRLRQSVSRPLGNARAAVATASGAPFDSSAAATERAAAGGGPARLGQPLDDALWDLTERVTRLTLQADVPIDVREAAAALQDLCLGSADGPAVARLRLDALRQMQAPLPSSIIPLPNGPLIVTNVDRVTTWLGAPVPVAPMMALCRCGRSDLKPLCDGSHAQNGFTDANDPKRVPDRLDTYAGPEVTVTDNRGTCAHSGFCTDSLAAVFHVDGEPFVTPGGGQPDAIARAVRACPSGALGYALATHGEGLADQAREPGIEVSRNGPYRVAGGVALLAPDGTPVPRNAGASLEHYSLCRCGFSRNKPYCSGMHWYVDFVDPLPSDSAPPSAPAISAEASAVTLPEPGATVTFDEHVKPLFRARDQQSMRFALDLWSYADVTASAADIVERVRDGSMPCDRAWPSEWVDVLERWVNGGMRESAASPAPVAAVAPTPGDAPNAGPEAIQGALGRALELRSSTPVVERELVIEHREPLIYMLCAAAELEHALMCEYLFAAFSLKRSVDEGLTEEQLAAVERWRSTILLVAKQEMLHLAINCNLVTSLGASPHLSRPNLPQPARHYPAGVRLALLPFGEQALRHFIYLERPEGMDIDDAQGLEAVDTAVPLMGEEEIAPHLQEFQTVGHLYRSIEAGFRHLGEKLGEEGLFLGPASAQASGDLFGWKELRHIRTVDDAVAAIEAIVAQGEGPRGDWRHAHFGRFVGVLDEYLEMVAANPGLEVARPVLPVLVRAPESGEEVPLITDPVTARVADICNVGYEVLLQLLYRLLCHVDETDEQIKTLADVSVGIMFDVIEPLADILTTMPVGPEHPGCTAGPTFELFYQPDYLLPHRRAAWLLMAEHLSDAAALCDGECIRDPRFLKVAEDTRKYAGILRDHAT